MKVDYYIDRLGKVKDKKVEPRLDYREIDSFARISEPKIELLKSVQPYLIDEEYIDILHLYNDYKYPIYDTGYVQVLDDNAVRCLQPIRLSWEGVNEYAPSIVLSEKEFLQKYNQIIKWGSQEYAFIQIRAHKYDEDFGYYKIFYTKDNHVFINSDAETAIAYWSVDDLGERLARVCKYHEGYARMQNEEYKLRMTKNYRNAR